MFDFDENTVQLRYRLEIDFDKPGGHLIKRFVSVFH